MAYPHPGTEQHGVISARKGDSALYKESTKYLQCSVSPSWSQGPLL